MIKPLLIGLSMTILATMMWPEFSEGLNDKAKEDIDTVVGVAIKPAGLKADGSSKPANKLKTTPKSLHVSKLQVEQESVSYEANLAYRCDGLDRYTLHVTTVTPNTRLDGLLIGNKKVQFNIDDTGESGYAFLDEYESIELLQSGFNLDVFMKADNSGVRLQHILEQKDLDYLNKCQ